MQAQLVALAAVFIVVGPMGCAAWHQMPQPLPGTNTHQLRMPGATVDKDDAYLCAAFKLDPGKISYVTGFRVEGSAERAHHMILRGCREVPSEADNSYWNCGSHGDCRSGSTTLFAWANNAPALTLPPSVGFRIGGTVNDTRVQYLVVQVHYAKQLANSVRDYSGMDIEITSEPQRYVAGIFLMVGQPVIPPLMKKVNIDACCPVSVPAKLNVFAARVHAHALGVVVSGYRYNPKTGETVKITKGNPQWPQAFFPTERLTLDNGDEILARCTYSSVYRNRTTYGGATGADEMCNLYMMYYTDQDPGPGFQSCGYVCSERQSAAYPADSDEPLPRNAVLEAYALHGAHSGASMSQQTAELNPITFDSADGHPMHHASHMKHVETTTTPTTSTTSATTTAAVVNAVANEQQQQQQEQQIYDQIKSDEQAYWNMIWLFYHRFFNY